MWSVDVVASCWVRFVTPEGARWPPAMPVVPASSLEAAKPTGVRPFVVHLPGTLAVEARLVESACLGAPSGLGEAVERVSFGFFGGAHRGRWRRQEASLHENASDWTTSIGGGGREFN